MSLNGLLLVRCLNELSSWEGQRQKKIGGQKGLDLAAFLWPLTTKVATKKSADAVGGGEAEQGLERWQVKRESQMKSFVGLMIGKDGLQKTSCLALRPSL